LRCHDQDTLLIRAGQGLDECAMWTTAWANGYGLDRFLGRLTYISGRRAFTALIHGIDHGYHLLGWAIFLFRPFLTYLDFGKIFGPLDFIGYF